METRSGAQQSEAPTNTAIATISTLWRRVRYLEIMWWLTSSQSLAQVRPLLTGELASASECKRRIPRLLAWAALARLRRHPVLAAQAGRHHHQHRQHHPAVGHNHSMASVEALGGQALQLVSPQPPVKRKTNTTPSALTE